jgi:hypothetical protein
MVGTQQVLRKYDMKGYNPKISHDTCLAEITLHLVLIYFSNLFTKWVEPNSHPKINLLKGVYD